MRKAGAAKALLDALQREPEPCTAVVPAPEPEVGPEVAIANWNVDMYGEKPQDKPQTFVNVNLSDMTAMGDSVEQVGPSLASQMAAAGNAMAGPMGAVVGGVMGGLMGIFGRRLSSGYTRESRITIVWLNKRKFERTFERILSPNGTVVDERLVQERELPVPTTVREVAEFEREDLLRLQAALNKPDDPERDLLYMAMNYAPELLEIARRDTERYDVFQDDAHQSFRIRDLVTGSTVVVSMRSVLEGRRR